MEEDPNKDTSYLAQGYEVSQTKKPAPPYLRGSACFLFCFILLLGGCEKKASDVVTSDIDTVLYTTFTTDVHTLISDSGITKYKLEAKYWYTYDKPEKKWVFPEGIYLEQFDTSFNIEASVEADTAYYYQDRKLWELKNNVKVLNRDGQHFFAETLYWDEANEEVYSRDPVRIERGKGEYLYAKYGFKSNQAMTKYELYSSSGHMDVEDDADASPMTPPTGPGSVAPSPVAPPTMPKPRSSRPDSTSSHVTTDSVARITAPASPAARKAQDTEKCPF